jgi:hypothetical protein
MRVRGRGLMRKRDLAEKSRWTRRRKTGEGHTRCEYGLPQQVISGRLINTMRTAPCGHGGLAASLLQGIAASLSFCLSSPDGA